MTQNVAGRPNSRPRLVQDWPSQLRLADRVVVRHGFDLAAVPHPIAVVYLVGQLEFEVASGGVLQWLTNSSGREAPATAAALREIGAAACAEIVDQIIATVVPAPDFRDDADRSRAVRLESVGAQSAWRELADDLLDWPDDVDILLRRFVGANAEAFVEG